MTEIPQRGGWPNKTLRNLRVFIAQGDVMNHITHSLRPNKGARRAHIMSVHHFGMALCVLPLTIACGANPEPSDSREPQPISSGAALADVRISYTLAPTIGARTVVAPAIEHVLNGGSHHAIALSVLPNAACAL